MISMRGERSQLPKDIGKVGNFVYATKALTVSLKKLDMETQRNCLDCLKMLV